MSKQIYEKVCNGDFIPDEELAHAIKDYEAAERALIILGQPFEISRKAITTTLIALKGFQRARKEK